MTISLSMTSGYHIATRHTIAPPQSARSVATDFCPYRITYVEANAVEANA